MLRLGYLLAYTIPVSSFLALQLRGIGTFSAILYAFGVLPLLEALLPKSARNPDPEEESVLNQNPLYDWILYSMVPIQAFLLLEFCRRFSVPTFTEGTTPSWLERLGLISALGLSCGVIGINVAHELGHRAQRLPRILARMLLATSLNWQFYIEHNRGHHKQVATPSDPESAHLNESIYAFWIRAIRDSFLGAWTKDPRELARGIAVELMLLTAIALNFGLETAAGFVGAALFGILLLQSVNYIEHYGLSRRELSPGRFEPVAPHHSWNANACLSRMILFELSRHSDHHAFASRKYPVLRHHDQSPQMPAGYPAMILIALIPPLWFRVIHPRLQFVRSSDR